MEERCIWEFLHSNGGRMSQAVNAYLVQEISVSGKVGRKLSNVFVSRDLENKVFQSRLYTFSEDNQVIWQQHGSGFNLIVLCDWFRFPL